MNNCNTFHCFQLIILYDPVTVYVSVKLTSNNYGAKYNYGSLKQLFKEAYIAFIVFSSRKKFLLYSLCVLNKALIVLLFWTFDVSRTTS